MFFPPVITVLACAPCFAIFTAQYSNQRALEFIGWDLYTELEGATDSRVNVIAHLSGAAIGFLLGFTVFRQKRHWAQVHIEDK